MYDCVASLVIVDGVGIDLRSWAQCSRRCNTLVHVVTSSLKQANEAHELVQGSFLVEVS